MFMAGCQQKSFDRVNKETTFCFYLMINLNFIATDKNLQCIPYCPDLGCTAIANYMNGEQSMNNSNKIYYI